MTNYIKQFPTKIEDEELELKDSGNYAFFVFDKNGDYVDITDKIDYLVPASENGIIYVQ